MRGVRSPPFRELCPMSYARAAPRVDMHTGLARPLFRVLHCSLTYSCCSPSSAFGSRAFHPAFRHVPSWETLTKNCLFTMFLSTGCHCIIVQAFFIVCTIRHAMCVGARVPPLGAQGMMLQLHL